MSESDDVLGREVAIAAKLDESGVSVRTKSRAVAAIDRLIGGLFDWPAALTEGAASKRRLRDEIERREMLVHAAIAERRLQGQEDSVDVFLIDLMTDAARKQSNKAAIAVEAVEAMKALPPPSVAAPEESSDAPHIDADWMNQFYRYAEDASSDDLQQLWGRVLAGEINRAGSFSRQTLRFIAELDRETAGNCEFAAKAVVGDFIPKTPEWSNGTTMSIGIDLQRLGLIEGVGSFGLQKNFKLTDGYEAFTKTERCVIVFGDPATELKIPAIMLTRLGREVFSLLSPSEEVETLKSFSAFINKAGLSRVELGRFVALEEGVNFTREEVLWQAAKAEG